MSKKQPIPNAVEILDEITRQVALDAAENPALTHEDYTWSRDLGVKIEARLAELRRNLTPADAPIEHAKPIRASTLAMARDVLLEAIAQITRSMGGAVQFAHRNLKGFSDDDLRRIYDTIDPTNRKPE